MEFRTLALFLVVILIVTALAFANHRPISIGIDDDYDNDGLSDDIDLYPMDLDNDGTPDSSDPFPAFDASLSLNITELASYSRPYLQSTSQMRVNATMDCDTWTSSFEEDIIITTESNNTVDIHFPFNVPDGPSEVNLTVSILAFSPGHHSSTYMDLDPANDSLNLSMGIHLQDGLNLSGDSLNGSSTDLVNVSFAYSLEISPATCEISLEWEYDGIDYNISMDMGLDDLHWYQACDIPRYYTGEDGLRLFLTPEEPFILELVSELEGMFAEGWDNQTKANMALAMVQSIDYQYDSDTSDYDEYWRFPLETLYLGYGDCEDTTLLYSVICTDLGLDNIILLYFPPPDSPIEGHAAVGVALPEFSGYYYVDGGVNYYFAETTGEGWLIGEMPADYVDVDAIVINVQS